MRKLGPPIAPHLTNKEILDYQNRAKAMNYLSHAHRYDVDVSYQASCRAHRPPTPRLLQFRTGCVA